MSEAKTAILVGRNVGLHEPRTFIPQGIFTGTDAKKNAEAVCTDEWFFYLKVDLNKDLALVDMPWDKVVRPIKPKE